MAYMAFDALGAVQQNDVTIDAVSERLSPLEWAVVVLARGDGLTSLREPGRLAVALGNLFGSKGKNRLADPRLEALRRVAVFAWLDRFAVPAHEITNFLSAGFTTGQYKTLLASIRVASLNGPRHA